MPADRHWMRNGDLCVIDVARTIEHVVGAIEAAAERREPFHHLRLASVFPAEVYSVMLDAMPATHDYGAMSGRAAAADGGSARTKIGLLPGGTIRLPQGKRAIWVRI